MGEMLQVLTRSFHVFVAAALLLPTFTYGQSAPHHASGPRQPLPKPKMVLAVMVDQLRYDYLMRWKGEFKGGFHRLLTKGANFTNGHLGHYPTVTAIGHTTILTGAYPINHGIVGNDWYDRESGKKIESITDFNEKNFGEESDGPGASPRRLKVSTLGDQMKMALGTESKAEKPVVVGISLKDRSAIMPSGHMADGAFWFDRQTGDFISSSYYFKELPTWVKNYNAKKPQDAYLGKDFLVPGLAAPFTKVPGTAGPMYYSSLWNTPYSSELIVKFAKTAIDQYKIGQRGAIDLLTVSFSANDTVGHRDGPDAESVHQMAVETDRILGDLFAYLDSKVGMDNVLVVLSADHGVGPMPETNIERNMPAGRIPRTLLFDTLQKALSGKYGEGKWILGTAGSSPYFDNALIKSKGINPEEFRAFAADVVRELPAAVRVYTRDQLLKGQVPSDEVGQRVIKSFNTKHSGDLEVIMLPYWIGDGSRATHGSPYSYDTHVPLLFMGPGVVPGYYDGRAMQQDVALTLATMLEIEPPSSAEGRVLSEMFVGVAGK